MKRPKAECYRLAEALGVEIDEEIGDAWAPEGKIFSETGTHCVVFETSDVVGRIGLNWWALLRILKGGIETCKDPNCEICRDEGR